VIVNWQTVVSVAISIVTAWIEEIKKLKAKARDSYIARLTGKPDQPRFTVIEVVVDRQEPMVLQR